MLSFRMFLCVFFFKQKTAYEMRISDWSSDVCSSDLVVCDIPLAPLADDAPLYDRPHVPTPKRPELTNVPETIDVAADLKTLMGSPDIASRRWIWEQYDSQVGADTVQIGRAHV